MFSFSQRSLAVVAGFGAQVCAAGVFAQTPPAHVHIELTVSHWPEDSSHTLNSRNFLLSQGGQPYAFHLARPADRNKPPAHVLLLAGEESASAVRAAAGPTLAGAWTRGWLVSIAAADRTTPYVASEAALDASLQSTTQPAQAALQQLESFAGRRMLVVADAGAQTLLPSSVTRSISEIYLVDKGVPVERTFDPVYLFGPCNYTGSTGIAEPQACGGDTVYSYEGNPELSPAVTTEDRSNGFRHGMWHGQTLGAAINQMFRDTGRYFDLEADVPAAALGSSFTLQFHRLPEGLRLRAEAYSERDGLREKELRLVLG